MTKKELERLVMATTQSDDFTEILVGEQLVRLFKGLVAIGVDEDSILMKYWNLDEYNSVGDAIKFLWQHREWLPN